MKKFSGATWLSCLLALAFPARSAEPPLHFEEVFQILKSNLAGVTEAQLEAAAAQGLIEQFKPRVSLVAGQPSEATAPAESLLKSARYEEAYGYFRFGRIRAGSDEKFLQEYSRFSQQGRLKGLVLDLRFAEGTDYAAAAALADLFLPPDQPLLNFGEGMILSKNKARPILLPLVVLVNSRTREAPEALAAILREYRTGLLIGQSTAGHAAIAREFPLKTGQRLRVATAPIQVKDRTLPLEGLKPDLTVEVSLSDEEAYLDDPYKVIKATSLTANAVPSLFERRTNEAELVRRHREGLNPLDQAPLAIAENRSDPQLQDPVLVRGLDFLKGLSVLQPLRNQ